MPSNPQLKSELREAQQTIHDLSAQVSSLSDRVSELLSRPEPEDTQPLHDEIKKLRGQLRDARNKPAPGPVVKVIKEPTDNTKISRLTYELNRAKQERDQWRLLAKR